MPGPGHYTKPYEDSFGKWGRSCESTYRNDPVRRFSKGIKYIVTSNFTPAPDTYNPRIPIPKWKIDARPTFGKSNVDIIAEKFGVKEAITKPGPG